MNEKEDIRSILGKNVKRYRKQRGFSQEQLSEIINVTPKHLSTIESGSAFVSADVLQLLADTLDVPVYLLFYNGPMSDLSNQAKAVQIRSIIDIQLQKAAESIKDRIQELF